MQENDAVRVAIADASGRVEEKWLHSADLDYAYFVAKVEPILAAPGPDGKACVMCHANHVIFKLKPPNQEGSFSSPDSGENYRYAMRVVDINDPQHSLILIKPTRPTDAGADVSDYYATHNGGQRWKGNESSWQYKTILEWIRGVRLDRASKAPEAVAGNRSSAACLVGSPWGRRATSLLATRLYRTVG
jgi:hypothetical protein